jgi:hypothetical protein
LTGDLWIQRAGETEILFGQVQVRYPSACDSSDPQYPGHATVNVSVDGDFIGSAYASFYPGVAGRTQTVGLYFYPTNGLLAPDSDRRHLIIAKVVDSCTGAGQDFTFDSFKVDVIGAS